MWHFLKHLFSNPHVHKTVHHASKHVAPTLTQVSKAAAVVGGINAGMSIYDRIKKKNESGTKQQGAAKDTDTTLEDDFLLHIEGMEKTINEIKNKNTSSIADIKDLKEKVQSFDSHVKESKSSLQSQQALIENLKLELQSVKKENKVMQERLLKSSKAAKGIIIAGLFITVAVTAALIYFYYALSSYFS